MIKIHQTYRPIIAAYLITFWFFIPHTLHADESQSFIKVNTNPITFAANISDASPSIAYNSSKNEYFIVYANTDGSCGNQRLFGVVANAITGILEGSPIPISACNVEIEDPQVIYNNENDEYGILYRSIAAFGSQILFQHIDASTFSVGAAVEIGSDPLSNPFKNNTIACEQNSNLYTLGFHEVTGSDESMFRIKYIDTNTKLLAAHSTVIDKNLFSNNTGIWNAKLIQNNGNIFTCFELKKISGTEIWGTFINPVTGIRINNFFQISPTPVSGTVFINPSPTLNSETGEILIAYESSHYQIPTASLNEKIKIQLINGSNGSLINPINQSVTSIPGTENNEGAKFPVVVYSPFSDEYVLFFYGKRWINSISDIYDIYVHRINSIDLSPIRSESLLISTSVGTTIAQNNSLRPLCLGFNSTNNQYILGWNKESNNNGQTQIWRYDNNLPTNLDISNSARNENMAIESDFGSLSSIDPDPEDNTLNYTLVSGVGSTDNVYFTISGSSLKIASNLNYEDANKRYIRVQATDTHGATTDKAIMLTINDVNEEPYNLALAQPLYIEENLNPDTYSNDILVEDEDIGNTHTFTLVAGTGDDHNSNFEIDSSSGILSTNKSLNFEETQVQNIRIRATDNTGLFVESAFVFEILDVNEEPEALELTPGSIPENDPESGSIIHVIDPDISSDYTFSLVSGPGDEDNEHFDIIGDALLPNIPLNFEQKNSYRIRLKADDGTYQKIGQFIINISDVNDPPEEINLSEYRILTGSPNGSWLGQITTVDQDLQDTHTYELIEGSEYFFVKKYNDGYDLHIINSLVYDSINTLNNYYTVKIRSEDIQGAFVEETFTIEVVLFIDDEKPVILDFDQNPEFVDSEQQSIMYSIKATDNVLLDDVSFFYRPIRSMGSYQTPDTIYLNKVDGKLFIADVPVSAGMMDEMGLEYYFKVSDDAGNIDSTMVGYTYLSYSPKSFEAVNKSYQGTADSYRIISNPYSLESNKTSRIFADYGSSNDDSWRLFSFINNENREIGNNSSSTIDQGKGYWFNRVEDLSNVIEFEHARTPEHNRDHPFAMRLAKGWNLIGNPYPFLLDWNFVLQENGHSANELSLFTFNSMYRQSTSLQEFEGAFVFAETAMDLIIPLENPVNSNGRIAQHDQLEGGWLVRFTLDNGQLKNEMGAIGMHELANSSFDQFDRPLLPRFIQHLDISFNHPEHFSNAFSQDVVGLKENHIWEFVASTNMENREITLSWEGKLFSGTDKQLVLYDVRNDQIINVNSEVKYEFTLDQPSTFQAIYGDKAFIAESLSKIKIEAQPPYPNPFNNDVWIPINLPYSGNTYQIEGTIYNLIGEKVFEIKEEQVGHGLYVFHYGIEQHGNLEKGIYIYSIKITNGLVAKDFHGRIVKDQ